MGEYAHRIEVHRGEEKREAIRAPEIGALSGPAGGPDSAGQSLGDALGGAIRPRQLPPETQAPLGPIGRLRQAAQEMTARAAERLRAMGPAAEKMEGDLERATEQGLSELKQRAVEIFTARYRPSGPEAEQQRSDFTRSRERWHRFAQGGDPKPAEPGNLPPPLQTATLTLQPYLDRGRERQEALRRPMEREGRTLEGHQTLG